MLYDTLVSYCLPVCYDSKFLTELSITIIHSQTELYLPAVRHGISLPFRSVLYVLT